MYGVAAMVTDGVRLADSVVLRQPGTRAQADPFARLGAARGLRSQGFFLSVPRPTGAALERYAGMPWPFDRFPRTLTPRQDTA